MKRIFLTLPSKLVYVNGSENGLFYISGNPTVKIVAPGSELTVISA